MSDFIALHWPAHDERASGCAALLVNAVRGRQWRAAMDQPGWFVATAPVRSDGAAAVVRGSAAVVGTLFDRSATRARLASPPPDLGGDPAVVARRLVRDHWGAYLFLTVSDGGTLHVLRDPIGMLDAATWRCAELRIVTSRPEFFVCHAPPPDLAVDTARVGTLLVAPGLVGEGSALCGIEALTPGVLYRFDAERCSTETLWRPADWARRTVSADPTDLRAVADACIAAWQPTARRGIAELSGGLDSAIVAAGLAQSGADRMIGWYHYVGNDPASDERVFARAVSARLGLPVTETELSPDPLTAALLEAIPVGFRPGLGSTSLFHDRQLSVTAASLGADMLFTGHGGDAVFFQPPTPWIACDLFAARRSWRTMISALTDLAAWTGTPVWAVLNAAWRARRGMIRIHGPVVPFAQTSSAKEEAPAWLDQAEDLAPAKQLQLWALGYARSAFGPSFCSAELEVRHPLLSQPLVEHVLGLSALTLTEGRRDRALARRAYAGRLPDALLARRGKGSLNRHYGQLLAGSLDVVRPYLLEGVLAERCIIVPDRLDAVLRVEALMAEDHYAAVFTILLLERWARGWEDIRAQARASPFRA